MGNNLRDLRRRLRSVKSTQQITRAMKLVAASKLRRAQEEMERFRPYAAGMRAVAASVGSRVAADAHPLLETRSGNRVLLVVITSDRGLAGSFNATVLRRAVAWMRENPDKVVTLEPIGRKARDFFKKRNAPIRNSHVDVFRRAGFDISRGIAHGLVAAFLEEGFDEVMILSNRFKTVMSQDLVLEQLLPIAMPEADANSLASDTIYEPDPATILQTVLPASVDISVHQALLDSYASEHGARMVAMEAATKNAGEMISRLTLQLNRTRQAAITTEIIEIVSGAAALGA